MPKVVYQCVYCYNTEENIKDAMKHEDDCRFNPELKNCYTCKFREDLGMPISGPMETCMCEDAPTFRKSDYIAMKELKGKPCEFWEKDND